MGVCVSIACDLWDLPELVADYLVMGRRPWVQPHCSACVAAAGRWKLPVGACIQSHLDPPRPCDWCLERGLS